MGQEKEKSVCRHTKLCAKKKDIDTRGLLVAGKCRAHKLAFKFEIIFSMAKLIANSFSFEM